MTKNSNFIYSKPGLTLHFKEGKSKKLIATILVLIILGNLKSFGQVPVNQVNSFLKGIQGNMRPQVSWYTGTRLDSVHSFDQGRFTNQTSEWSCTMNLTPDPEKNTMDLTATFKLEKGNVSAAAVSVAFDFSSWSTENYVLVPAIVYNSNRYRTIGNGYNITYPKDMYYNPELPLTISNTPQLALNTGVPSLIELQTTNASTPAVCFFSPFHHKGFILLTEQGTRLGNSGITITENPDRTKATIEITAPSVRKLAAGFGNFHPSGDSAATWREGEEVSLKFRLYSFEANSIPDLLTKFMLVRKSLSGLNHPRNLVPSSKLLELGTGICSNKYITVPAGSYYAPENDENFQLGWVSGMINTFPMLYLNNEKERQRVIKELDFVVNKLQGKSGYFYGGITAEGVIRPEKVNSEFPETHAMVRKNGDVLYWMIKHFLLFKEQGHAKQINTKWEESAKKLAEAFVKAWKKYGRFGQYLDPETGEIAVFNSSAGVGAPAGLALASDYFHEKEFLQVAIESAHYYYNRDVVKQGLTGGYCADISQDADSESAFGFLKSLMALYYSTNDKIWLEKAKVQASLCATWTLSYDVIFPPVSQIGKLKSNMAGAVFASIQNKHSAPGICTSSGDYLFKLYRATGDRLYADLINDIQHAHTEAVDMPGHRTNHIGFGSSMERIQPSDAEGKGSIGNFIQTRNSWTETNGMLMAMEIPGIYLQTNTNELYVFDQVEVKVLNRNLSGVHLSISNKTLYDAEVSIFAETSAQAKRPLGFVGFNKWKKTNIKAGKTVLVTVLNNGEVE